MHSDILNYTKLAFNSLKMIQNDTVYQPIKQGMIGLLILRSSRAHVISRHLSDVDDFVEQMEHLENRVGDLTNFARRDRQHRSRGATWRREEELNFFFAGRVP